MPPFRSSSANDIKRSADGEAHTLSQDYCQAIARTLFRHADEGLYEAKRAGRNCMRSAGMMKLVDVTIPEEDGATRTEPPVAGG